MIVWDVVIMRVLGVGNDMCVMRMSFSEMMVYQWPHCREE